MVRPLAPACGPVWRSKKYSYLGDPHQARDESRRIVDMFDHVDRSNDVETVRREIFEGADGDVRAAEPAIEILTLRGTRRFRENVQTHTTAAAGVKDAPGLREACGKLIPGQLTRSAARERRAIAAISNFYGSRTGRHTERFSLMYHPFEG